MKCGIKFCGGCNPRYDRGAALREIKSQLPSVDFEYAEEGIEYDIILVIGGCTSCCASYEQYTFKNTPIKIWDKAHIDRAITILREY